MKILLVIAVLIISACAQDAETPVKETFVDEKTILETVVKDSTIMDRLKDEKPIKTPIDKDEVRIEETNRIASGVDANTGENLDYVLLTVIFYNQMQTCGGIFVHPQYVLTTATCVKDPVEGVASIINATFPQKAAPNVMPKLQIFIHEMFDQLTYANNVALIKLMNATAPDNKTLAIANFTTNIAPDAYVNQSLRLCGFGSIANYYTKPAKMKCTDLFIQPTANCSATLTNIICSFWTDRDNNACNNDYGGALYLYSYNGAKINQTVVGMASFSPDYRPNAPCYDGHKVVHVQISNYYAWAANIIATSGSTPPPAR